MRSLYLLFSITILSTSALYSQNLFTDEADSNVIFLAIEGKPYPLIHNIDFFQFHDAGSYKNFIDTNKLSGVSDINDFDFYNRTLVLLNYRGVDCKSRFDISLIKNDEEKIYDIYVGIIYGGCRAGGRTYSAWISIPKVPYDYKLQSSRVILDNESEEL